MESRITKSAFVPARWLRNRHLQTMFPILPWVNGPRLALVHEALELPDGDITSVDWLTNDQAHDDSPLLVILHGLEGSAASPYCRHLLRAAAGRGWNAVVLHFRDCGDFRNRLPRRYHAGETDDLRYFLDLLRRRGYSGPLLASGYSLGANVLLKYLGEAGDTSPLLAATAVSAPLNLHISAATLQVGFARIYQSYLLKRAKRSVFRKFNAHTAPFNWTRAVNARTFAEFDDAVTAPLHGFADKDDYYNRCSANNFLRSIERPTLL
ncbi:MAG: alpha/beta fold hydrolase, partial [Woeseia sp.]